MLTKQILRYAQGLLSGFLCDKDVEHFKKEPVHY